MKKIIKSILYVWIFQGLCLAQGYPCLNGVSTDYSAPTATPTALPTNPTPTGQSNFGERFINEFNWFPISPDGLYNGYPASNDL